MLLCRWLPEASMQSHVSRLSQAGVVAANICLEPWQGAMPVDHAFGYRARWIQALVSQANICNVCLSYALAHVASRSTSGPANLTCQAGTQKACGSNSCFEEALTTANCFCTHLQADHLPGPAGSVTAHMLQLEREHSQASLISSRL